MVRELIAMIVYAVVSAETGQAVELLRDREPAEAFNAEVEQDEPETALLRVEEIAFTESSQ